MMDLVTPSVTFSTTKSVALAFLVLSLPPGRSRSAMAALGNFLDESMLPTNVTSLTFLARHPLRVTPDFSFASSTDPNFG